MVMTINQPCDTVDASGEWFGLVRWCNDDIEAQLEECGVPVTDANVSAVRTKLEKHWFADHMIEAGWDFIENTVLMMKMDGDLAQ